MERSCSAKVQLMVLLLLIAWPSSSWVHARTEAEVLMDVKAALDPQGTVLQSWKERGQPCNGSFEGVLCDSGDRVANISLQGKSLSGFIPGALSELTGLSSLFLHYNNLQGDIPASLSSLTSLTDLYLNVNRLSGGIPPQLGLISSLQVLELCCNKLEGQIPAELSQLTQLEALALNDNQLNGTLPESLGNLTALTRMDVSDNLITGSIPSSIASLSDLTILNVCNNSLSGPVPVGLFKLKQGFTYSNNSALCSTETKYLSPCPISTAANQSSPAKAVVNSPSNFDLNMLLHITTAVILAIGGSAFLILIFICVRRRKARLRILSESNLDTKFGKRKNMKSESKAESTKSTTSTSNPLQTSSFRSTPDLSVLGLARSRVLSDRSTSTTASKGLPSPSEWSLWIHLDELEIATNYFSEKNLLQKNVHSAVYKGTLQNGSAVAIKAIYNTRFLDGEQEFVLAVDALMLVKHENLVNFLGLCCSKGGSECFLVYEFLPYGSLEHHLHGTSGNFINWSSRVNIIRGVAKGLAYLHQETEERAAVVHQNLWTGNVLLDKQGNSLLADYGLSEIVAKEVMYSTHKTLAALGYLAPEYAYIGHSTEDSDVYAFGALVLELLTGRRPLCLAPQAHTLTSTAAWVKPLLDLGKVRDFVDPKLGSSFSLAGAAGLAHIALQCMCEDQCGRPAMADVLRRLHASEHWADMAIDSFLLGTPGMFTARQPFFNSQADTGYQGR